jgi:hypothetical protein
MKDGDTWEVPGVALARRTGSENSIGPGILLVSSASFSLWISLFSLHLIYGGEWEWCELGNHWTRLDLHKELVGCLFKVRHSACCYDSARDSGSWKDFCDNGSGCS